MPPQDKPSLALAVTPREACRLLSIGNTHLYKLINTGELESYLDGRARRITMESIHRRIRRLLATSGIIPSTSEPQPRRRGLPRKSQSIKELHIAGAMPPRRGKTRKLPQPEASA